MPTNIYDVLLELISITRDRAKELQYPSVEESRAISDVVTALTSLRISLGKVVGFYEKAGHLWGHPVVFDDGFFPRDLQIWLTWEAEDGVYATKAKISNYMQEPSAAKFHQLTMHESGAEFQIKELGLYISIEDLQKILGFLEQLENRLNYGSDPKKSEPPSKEVVRSLTLFMLEEITWMVNFLELFNSWNWNKENKLYKQLYEALERTILDLSYRCRFNFDIIELPSGCEIRTSSRKDAASIKITWEEFLQEYS